MATQRDAVVAIECFCGTNNVPQWLAHRIRQHQAASTMVFHAFVFAARHLVHVGMSGHMEMYSHGYEHEWMSLHGDLAAVSGLFMVTLARAFNIDCTLQWGDVLTLFLCRRRSPEIARKSYSV